MIENEFPVYDPSDTGPQSNFGRAPALFKGGKSNSSASQTDRKITVDGEKNFAVSVSDGASDNVINVETADDDVLQAAFDQVAAFSEKSLGTVERLSKGNLEAAERTQNAVKDLVAENNAGRTEIANLVMAGMLAAATTVTAVKVSENFKSKPRTTKKKATK